MLSKMYLDVICNEDRHCAIVAEAFLSWISYKLKKLKANLLLAARTASYGSLCMS